MQKKTVSLSFYLVSLFCTIVLTAVVVFFLEKTQFTHQESVIKVTRSELDEVQDLYDLISTNYVGEVDKDELIKGALSGMTNALGDPYSEFLSAKETKELDDEVAGTFEGIGANLQLKDRMPTIDQVPIKDSPAEKAGLKSGDVILEINGEATQGQSLDVIASSIRGEKGTEVHLMIQRGTEQFSVSIKRDVVPNETVKGQIDKDHPTIGVIQLANFRETTALEFRNKVEELRENGAESFIVDIRQNSGSLLNEAERVASYFMEDGDTIVQFADENDVVAVEKANKEIDDGFKVKEPVVFLVDQETAAGAELVAAAVKSKDIPVIGTRTFGKGTVQNVQPIGEESYVQLTILKWLTPDGEWLNEKGVTPTIEVGEPGYANLPPLSRQSNWRIGDHGEAITNLNAMLNALDYDTEGDQFDIRTRHAVTQIQTENNLPATGAVDVKTSQAIQEKLFQLVKSNDATYKRAIEALS
ncbi:PDZ domain-containing protein [Enterococcus sp. 669A]|uniref:PDZ domain-containing protein n=1 Tax=Candidatus Enterococcus moelleringii TaxID=2815325 RepID=A0ABS3LCH8_9ENTE|nr:S41 family peptidase [Enterococcus sp. 669A]MBO1306780.1 PDZ domain-containing protein [Enterococcus sp. 669A]